MRKAAFHRLRTDSHRRPAGPRVGSTQRDLFHACCGRAGAEWAQSGTLGYPIGDANRIGSTSAGLPTVGDPQGIAFRYLHPLVAYLQTSGRFTTSAGASSHVAQSESWVMPLRVTVLFPVSKLSASHSHT